MMNQLKSMVISFILMVITITSMMIAPAYAIEYQDVWQSAGGAGGVSGSTTAKGVWDHSYQGFRITVLDWAGEPAFTFNGRDYLDLLFTYPGKCSYYGIENKTDGLRNATLSYDTLKAIAYPITISDLYSAIDSGQFGFDTPGDVATTASNLKNIPYHIWQSSNNTWYKQGTKVKAKMYGPGEADIDKNAALFAILNLRSNSGYFWQPKSDITLNPQYSAEEKAALVNSTTTPMTLMASRKLVISVEPIVWNQLRLSASQFSKYSVYGTQTDVGYLCNWLTTWESDFSKAIGAKNGGYDWSLFGKVGRKAMVTTKPITFSRYTKGEEVVASRWTIQVPVDDGNPVDNKTVAKMDIGWSLHLYQLKPAGDMTHTWDEENYPTPDKFKEHPAPDPKTDPPTKDKIESLKNQLRYRIVKVYEEETIKEDGTIEVKHITTTTRKETLPKILIQDETEAGGYEVINWKYSPLYYPTSSSTDEGQIKDAGPIPITTPWDNTVVCDDPSDDRISAVPSEPAPKSGTEPCEVDIANPNDKNQMVTLYVRLRKKAKVPETHTFDDPVTPGPAPDPLEEDPDMTEPEKKQLVHTIVKVYEVENLDGTITTEYVFERADTAGIILVETEFPPKNPGYKLVEWMYSKEDPDYPYPGLPAPNGTDDIWDDILKFMP